MNEVVLNFKPGTTNVQSLLVETGDTNFIRTIHHDLATYGHRHTG
jgi:hypothetical protein